MAPVRGPAVPRRRLGAELRRLREAAHMLLEQAAHELECSTSKISRLENGKGVPRARDVRDLLDIYGVHDEKVRERLQRWAREGQQQGWWEKYADLLRPGRLRQDHLDTLYALEADASAIDAVHNAVVPGLLQTREYAAAIFGAVFSPAIDSADVERLVELRMQRQQVVTRSSDPVQLTCVVDEAALLRPMGDSAVMRGQLTALCETVTRPNVEVLILPLAAGPHPMMAGPFTILRFEEENDRDVVYLEHHTGAVYLEHKHEVDAHRALFDVCRRAALDQADSVKLISRYADESS